MVPSRVELPLARALLGDVTLLADAEQIGVLEVRPDAVAFRHELARRAVEGTLPRSVQIELNARRARGVARPRRGRPRADRASRRGRRRRRRGGRARPGGRAAGVCGRRPGQGACCTGLRSRVGSCSPRTRRPPSARRTRGRSSTPTTAMRRSPPPSARSGCANSSGTAARSAGRWPLSRCSSGRTCAPTTRWPPRRAPSTCYGPPATARPSSSRWSTWASCWSTSTASARAWPRSTRPSRWGSGSALTRCGRRR